MFRAGGSPATWTAAARWWCSRTGIGDRRQDYRFLAPMLAQAEGVLRLMSESDFDLVSVLPLAARERQARGRGWWFSLARCCTPVVVR